MTDNQKIAYEWAKSHDYPSIAARYARELAGLVDDLQGAYDAMVRDLTARTRQVRQLQGEISALRQQDVTDKDVGNNEPLTLDELRQMDGEPVWCVSLGAKLSRGDGWYIGVNNWYMGGYGKKWMAYRQKPEEGTV